MHVRCTVFIRFLKEIHRQKQHSEDKYNHPNYCEGNSVENMSEYVNPNATGPDGYPCGVLDVPAPSIVSVSSGYATSAPTTPNSPGSLSPVHTLKRSRKSSFKLIDRRISNSSDSEISPPHQECDDKLAALIGWYPSFLIKIYLELFGIFFFVIFKRLPVIIPTLWITAFLWCFSHVIIIGLTIVKNMLVYLLWPWSMIKGGQNPRRTVLISGGSTIQSIHLARNFSSAGTRVIICDTRGHFPLAQFSTTVDEYHTIPQPTVENIDSYIEALKDLVIHEQVQYFIPVSETNGAYFDALAKPHLQVLGCQSICPEVREVLLLDDPFEFMRKVQSSGLPTPTFYPIASTAELNRLYDLAIVKRSPHFMVNTGLEGCKNRVRIDLPNSRKKFKFEHHISEQYPWLVVENVRGEKYVTCTTIKDSKIVCNVTCKVDPQATGLRPVSHSDIEDWLQQFFAGLKAHRKIVGHFSFYFTVTDDDIVLPTDCQVGVRLPYICYTSVQSRMIWKPCRHFSRHRSGPIVVENGKYWFHNLLIKTIRRPSFHRIHSSLKVLHRCNDALFEVWDPLPYCVYYCLQLPLNKIYSLMDRLNGVTFMRIR